MTRLLLIATAFLAIVNDARTASAQAWVDVNQLDGKLPDWVDPQYVRTPVRPAPPAVEYRRVWVEPVYRVICRRVWVESVVRTEWVRTWVPPRYEIRDLVCYENGVRVIRQERVCIEPGRWTTERREVIVSPGGWQTVEQRELITPGYWKLEPA